MNIARRTGGGRGVYELAGETPDGTPARDLAGRELILSLPSIGDIPLGIRTTMQGAKPRLVLATPGGIHIQRQVAALLLLPKPIRADEAMGQDLPHIIENRYAIDKLGFTAAEVQPATLRFVPSTVLLEDAGSNTSFPFFARLTRIAALWQVTDQLPPAVAEILEAHRTATHASAPIGADTESLIASLLRQLSVLAIPAGIPYSPLSDPLQALEQLASATAAVAPQPPPLTPEEVVPQPGLIEGAVKKVIVNAYERNPQARAQCIHYYGAQCIVCGMTFLDTYGDLGRDYIHVHHLRPLGELRAEYSVDPIGDLCPVCPNCHSMLHRRSPPLTIDELRGIVRPT